MIRLIEGLHQQYNMTTGLVQQSDGCFGSEEPVEQPLMHRYHLTRSRSKWFEQLRLIHTPVLGEGLHLLSPKKVE